MSASAHRFRDDQPVSPGTKHPEGSSYFGNDAESPASRRGPLTAPFANHRQELHVADSPNIPSISRDPPSAPLAQIAPWETESARLPSTARLPPSKSFFFDDEGPENGHRPVATRTNTNDSFNVPWGGNEDRQPSITSSTTTTTSRTSGDTTGARSKARKFVGKIKGDEAGSQLYSDLTPAASESSLRPRASTTFSRKNERPASPSSARPRTPQAQLPSSDVAPWVFQDREVS